MLKMREFPGMQPGETQNFQSTEKPSVIQLDKGEIWQVKETIFSAIFPTGEEPNPFIVAECRRIDPGFCVVWCTKVMETPAHTIEPMGHYVICRYVPSSAIKIDFGKRPIKLGVIPKDFPFPSDSIYELESWTTKWPKGSWGARLGLPDMPRPFDERVIEYVKFQDDLHKNVNVKDVLRSLMEFEEREEKELRKVMAEAEYELKQDWKEAKRCIEEGQLLPTRVWEKTPFVETPKVSQGDK